MQEYPSRCFCQCTRAGNVKRNKKRCRFQTLPLIDGKKFQRGISLHSRETNPIMDSVNGSKGPWLQRFANGRPVRKHRRQQPCKAAPDQSRDVIASLQCIFDRENFVREVDRYLRQSDFLYVRKTELLYKKYLEDVSEPFMRKMKDQMDSQSEEEVHKRRQEQFSEYLNYCTKKGCVFLDDYDPSEYDPFFQKTCPGYWKV